MVQILEFALLVIGVSASGVMAPGPLFTANISYGLRYGVRSGLKMAIGHTIVELPLVILLGIGVFSLETLPEFRTVVSILGAITLFTFAFIQIRAVLKKNKDINTGSKHSPLVVGIALSALNPFFIIWWIAVGFKLISDAVLMWAFAGILIVFALHIWMDFVWLGVTALLASKSSQIISNRNYKIILIGLNIMLIYFGIGFLTDI